MIRYIPPWSTGARNPQNTVEDLPMGTKGPSALTTPFRRQKGFEAGLCFLCEIKSSEGSHRIRWLGNSIHKWDFTSSFQGY